MEDPAPSQDVPTKKAKRWPKWAKAALAHFRLAGNVALAAGAAGVDRRTILRLRGSDEAFSREWEEAREEAADHLEGEARRRAVDGWDEPVYGSGGTGAGTVNVGTIRKYDSTLLIFLLKGARPEKYRERRELSGNPDAPLLPGPIRVVFDDALDEEEAQDEPGRDG